ncbi:MAG: protein translocase subunit SecD, partial [Alphaproteobacteria bacterium]
MTLAVLLASIIVAVPNVLPRSVVDSLPSWLPARQVVLGLDLQGGSHLLLRVETDSVVNDYLDSVVDLVRASLREDRIGYRGLGVAAGRVRLTLTDPAEGDAAMTLLRAIDHDLSVERQGDAITVSLSQEAADARASNAVSQSIEIIRRRVDESGTTEPLIQRQGADRILVQLPGVDDPERMKSLLGRTARMTFHLVDEEVTAADIAGGRVPAGRLVLPVEGAGQQEAGRLAIERRTRVSGENLTDAQATFHQGQPVVSFRFDSLGARQFATITTENVGRRFAIVLDERIISAPVMREPILGGNGIISGSFSAQEVQDLALLLRAGALPAPLTIIEERTVGPSLGSDSISAGKLAAGVGLVIVTGFMLVTYGRFGLYANIALVSNIILLFAVLTALKATLTLPGKIGRAS